MKRWVVIFLLFAFVTVGTFLAIGKAQSREGLLDDLPFPAERIDLEYNSTNGDLRKIETWSLEDIPPKEALAFFKTRCTEAKGWDWHGLATTTWQADREVNGKYFETIVVRKEGEQLLLHRNRPHSKVAYYAELLESGGKLKILHVNKSGWWYSAFP